MGGRFWSAFEPSCAMVLGLMDVITLAKAINHYPFKLKHPAGA